MKTAVDRRRRQALSAEFRKDWTWEDKVFTQASWRRDVANDYTLLGYFAWVRANLKE